MKTIKIKDYNGEYQEIPVEDRVYEEWCELRREEDRLRKRELYHCAFASIEDLEQGYCTNGCDPVLDSIVRNEENLRLYAAIEKLTPTQRRRVKMFMDNMTYSDIARAEGRNVSATCRSLQKAFLRLRLLMGE